MFIFDGYSEFMVTRVSRTQHGGVCYAGSWNSNGTLEKVDPDDSFLPEVNYYQLVRTGDLHFI